MNFLKVLYGAAIALISFLTFFACLYLCFLFVKPTFICHPILVKVSCQPSECRLIETFEEMDKEQWINAIQSAQSLPN